MTDFTLMTAQERGEMALDWIMLRKRNEAFAINLKYYDKTSRIHSRCQIIRYQIYVDSSSLGALSPVFDCSCRIEKSIICHLRSISTKWNRFKSCASLGGAQTSTIILHEIFSVSCRRVRRFLSPQNRILRRHRGKFIFGKHQHGVLRIRPNGTPDFPPSLLRLR